MKKMDVSRVSSEEIITLFEEVFENQVGKYNDINVFEVFCNDRVLGKPLQVEVNVIGHAGTPTIDQFKKGEIENAKFLKISREDIGELQFRLLPDLTTYVSGNDFIIVYEEA